MVPPSLIRSTAGFRNITLFELNTSGLLLGAATLRPYSPYVISSGSYISGSITGSAIPTGTTISGSIAYYGVLHSGAKVLTITDPQPRVLPHVGDDGVFSLQVLPATEPANGEMHVDKTNDRVDAIIGNVNSFQVGEANLQGAATSKRGFENVVGAMAYSYAQDTDPDSVLFGSTVWDFRIFPRAVVFQRDTGYGQEINERTYNFTPLYVTSHIWGTAFSLGTEGFVRTQIIRGVSQYKPTLVSWKGDGTTLGFPFDSAAPSQTTGKISCWVNGVLQVVGATFQTTVRGIGFNVAPASGAVITCLYEQ